MDQFLSAIILGIVEGITEFLPISSTGHLIIVNRFVNLTGEFAHTFDVVIQFGAILSVIVYFRERLFPPAALQDMDRAPPDRRPVEQERGRRDPGPRPRGRLRGGDRDASVQPTRRGGHAARRRDHPHPRRAPAYPVRIDDVASLSYRVALAIGLIQCVAMIPGTSRSAATIIGAMALGCSRRIAAEFSFFLAIPTMLAASAYSLMKLETGLTGTQWQVLATGFVVSFLVAWAVVAFLMNYIRKHDFVPFGYYRIVLGLLVLGYFGIVLKGLR